MSFKRTAVIALIFLLLGGFYYFHEIKGKPGREEQKKKETAVLTIEEPNVTSLTIVRDIKPGLIKVSPQTPAQPEEKGPITLVFIKEKDKWMMKQPDQAAADKNTISNLVKQLVESKKDSTVEEDPKDLDKYGLEKPVYTVTISDGKKSETLMLGSQTAGNEFFYGKLPKSKPVFLIASGLKSTLDTKKADFRDKTFITVEGKDIDGIKFQGSKETYEFKKQGETWNVVKPRILHPGSVEIASFVDNIALLRAKEFFKDNPQNRIKFGLNKPSAQIEIYAKGSGKPLFLNIGKEDKKSGYLYAALEGSNEIIGLEYNDRDKFNKKSSDFISHSLLKADSARTATLTVILDGKEMTFKQETDSSGTTKWKMVKPEAKDVDGESINALFNTISTMYVKEAFPAAKLASKSGLSSPVLAIKAEGKDGKKLFEVKFGKEDTEYKEKGFAFAQIEGEDSILLVGKGYLETLKTNLKKYSAPPAQAPPQAGKPVKK